MSEKNYERKIEFQKKTISRQSKQIESLKSQIEKLKLECEEKDEVIDSIAHLKNELTNHIKDIKAYKKEYIALIEEVKKMKNIMNQTVYKNRWKLIRLLIK